MCISSPTGSNATTWPGIGEYPAYLSVPLSWLCNNLNYSAAMLCQPLSCALGGHCDCKRHAGCTKNCNCTSGHGGGLVQSTLGCKRIIMHRNQNAQQSKRTALQGLHGGDGCAGGMSQSGGPDMTRVTRALAHRWLGSSAGHTYKQPESLWDRKWGIKVKLQTLC